MNHKTKLKYNKTLKLNITDVIRACPTPTKVRVGAVFCLYADSKSSFTNEEGRIK